MKKRFALSLLAYSIMMTARLCAQNYTPFPTENMQWTTKKVEPQFGPADDNEIYWRIYTDGDTLINGKTYTNLKHKWECYVLHDLNNNVSYINNFPYGAFQHVDFLIGAIREEDKRIYFYPYAISWMNNSGVEGLAAHQDHLLYDFNVTAGDTVHFSQTAWTEYINGNPIVHTEDHLTIINTASGDGAYGITPSDSWSFPNITGLWTEGVGSSFGLFGSYNSLLTFLVCHGPIEPTTCTPCETAVGLAETPWEDHVRVFPNPANTALTISNDGNPAIEQIRLFDMYGRLLQQINCQDAGQRISLDVSDVSGLFFVVNMVFDGNYTLSRKIVKAE